MDRNYKDKLKEKVFGINENMSEQDVQKIVDLMEEEVKKASHQAIYSLEVQYMLDEWLEEEFPGEHEQKDKTIH